MFIVKSLLPNGYWKKMPYVKKDRGVTKLRTIHYIGSATLQIRQ
jgi:hypothetical protein